MKDGTRPKYSDTVLSIIIPAHNEAGYIGNCLRTVIGQVKSIDVTTTIVVILNACTDRTLEEAQQQMPLANAMGVDLHIVESLEKNKGIALNIGDDIAPPSEIYVYLDADVLCEDGLIHGLLTLLEKPDPCYASGIIKPIYHGWWSAAYVRIWCRLPFVTSDVCGCGLYAVNRAGRRRWDRFPLIHSDDKFVRLHFSHQERKKFPVEYRWPVPNGFLQLVRVRSRWNRGNHELASRYPELLHNEQPKHSNRILLCRIAVKYPVSFFVFSTIYALALIRSWVYNDSLIVDWERGR